MAKYTKTAFSLNASGIDEASEYIANELGNLIDQANRLVQFILSSVGAIIPVFIFMRYSNG